MDYVTKINELLEKYSEGGVITTSGLTSQLGSPSAEVLLTDGVKKRKKIKKADAAGIITTIDGKKIKLTGLTNKEKDEYLFGDTKIKKALDHTDVIIEYLEALLSPEFSEDSLEKCDTASSKLIKNKEGVWRRIGGRPCFICKDGVIHAGPPKFVGKKASSLRDDLRTDRSRAKFHKRLKAKSDK